MEKPIKAAFSLDTFRTQNWDIKAQPASILNQSSTLHERVAYCWGMAIDMLEICELLNVSESVEVARVSVKVRRRCQPA